jgi:hypothetical protein
VNDEWLHGEHESECRVACQFAIGVVALIAALFGVAIVAIRRR